MLKIEQSVNLSLAQALALVDDPPAHLSDQQKRRLVAFANKYQQSIRRTQRERYNNVMTQAQRMHAEIAEQMAEQEKQVDEINKAVRTGKMSAQQARESLTRVFRDIRIARERLAGVERATDDGWSLACQDPAEFQAERLGRFPSMRGASLTEAYLYGKEDSPFD